MEKVGEKALSLPRGMQRRLRNKWNDRDGGGNKASPSHSTLLAGVRRERERERPKMKKHYRIRARALSISGLRSVRACKNSAEHFSVFEAAACPSVAVPIHDDRQRYDRAILLSSRAV